MLKQVKRGLALTLAAALTFGMAPLAGIGTTTIAEAAAGNLSTTESVTFTLGSTDKIYQTILADKLSSLVGATATATVGDKSIIGLALNSDLKDNTSAPVTIDELKSGAKQDGTAWKESIDVADAATKINVKALKAGSTTIKLQATDGAKTTQTINVTVSEQTSGIKVTDKDGAAVADGGSLNVVEGGNVTAKVTLENMKTSIASLGNKSDGKTSGYAISDEKIATATFAGDTFTFKGLSEGTADVTLYLVEDGKTFSFHINVIPQTRLTTTIDGVQYVYGPDNKWKVDDKEKNPVIYLNPTDNKVTISVASNNGNAVAYSTTASDIVVGNTGLIEAKLDADKKTTPGTYGVDVQVGANDKTGQEARSAKIGVIVSSKKAKLVSLEVKNSAGVSIGKASAVITGPDTYDKGEETADTVNLSVKDKLTETLTLETNVDKANFIDASSSDEKVVTYKDGVLTAVGAGTAVVTITARPDSTAENYEAIVKIPVKVSDKKINNPITVSPIVLTTDAPEATIDAKAACGNKLSFPTLARQAVSSDPAAEQKAGFHDYNDLGTSELFDVTVDKNTGKVTYKKNGKSGDIYVKIVGEANAESEAPETTYVKVSYGTVGKKDSDLKLSKDRYEMVVGDAVSAGAVSTQVLSYASDKPEVASVDEKGNITAVAAGTAVITVKAAENDSFRAGEAKIVVIVSEKEVPPAPAEKAENPMTAKGKTVSVKFKKVSKGDVKVKKSKAFSVKNAQGSVSFSKKSGNGKIKVASSGKLTIKKGLKKGTFKVKVKVKAAGNSAYKSATKTVTVTIKVA